MKYIEIKKVEEAIFLILCKINLVIVPCILVT